MFIVQISLFNLMSWIVNQSFWNYLNKTCPFLLFTSLNVSQTNPIFWNLSFGQYIFSFWATQKKGCGSRVDHLRVILYLFFLVGSSAEMHSRFDQRHLVSYSVQRLLIHILQFQEQHWPSNQYEMLRWFFSSVLTYSCLKGAFIYKLTKSTLFFYN